jgi:glycosyltransferase involved in cell wall biosynthesis
MLPKVTVLMPAYNSAELLSCSIKSILNQTYKEFEFLIIDNASKDNTREVIDSFKDPRIVYHRIEERGIGNALNFGLQAASSDIIIRMDADDISLPERIEKQLKFFLKQKQECIASCSYGVFESARKGKNLRFIINVNTAHDSIRKRLALHSELIHPGFIFRKATLIEAGGYNNTVFEDYDLLLRVKDRVKFYNLNEILLLYRYSTISESRKNIKEKNKIVYEIQKPYYEKGLAEEFNIDKKDVNEIRGWREYFYGDKRRARSYWKRYGIQLSGKPRVIFAFLISFLPENFFIKFKEKRIRLRISYLLNYYNSGYRQLRNFLKLTCH